MTAPIGDQLRTFAEHVGMVERFRLTHPEATDAQVDEIIPLIASACLDVLHGHREPDHDFALEVAYQVGLILRADKTQ